MRWLGFWVLLCLAHCLHAQRPEIPAGHYWEKQDVRKIAIIGAGPTGSSAAYYLSRAQNQFDSTRLDITIYERSKKVGGRVAVVYPHNDQQYEPVELGASIFADVNLNIRRAVKEFHLETGAQNGESGEMGVWDGQQFLFVGDASSWWTSAKFFLRYGYSAATAQNIVKKQLGFFSRLYDPAFLRKASYPWSSVGKLAQAVNATALASMTGLDYFKEHRVSDLFIEEMIEAATRVNYAQDTDHIHAFGALVSLAASGATGVKQGNYRIFEEFVQRSGATLHTGLEGEVTGILKFADEQWYVGTKSGEGDTYDAVIIATPWHNADITLLNTASRVQARPFVHLHVTLLTTTAKQPNPLYFGLGKQDTVPATILTSDESMRRSSKRSVDFFSLNYLRPLDNGEHVVKIFSHEAISDDLLDRLFDLSTITWTKRHEWDSYPLLTPTTRFPHIQIDEGLYYPNAMESLVSTMETSTISARNSVALLLRKWFGDKFVNGENCTEDNLTPNANWAGWGCNSG